MGFGQNHEIHKRRFGRNLGVGLLLAVLAMLTFGLTIVKVGQGVDIVPDRLSLPSAGE